MRISDCSSYVCSSDLALLAGAPFGWLVEGVLASTLLAFRGLYDAVKAVARGLGESLQGGRLAVSRIVGRDPASLDAAGVARAAAESAAANFSDGFVGPVFWFLLIGLPDRKSDGWGKSVSVRVDSVGRRIYKKKNYNKKI